MQMSYLYVSIQKLCKLALFVLARFVTAVCIIFLLKLALQTSVARSFLVLRGVDLSTMADV